METTEDRGRLFEGADAPWPRASRSGSWTRPEGKVTLPETCAKWAEVRQRKGMRVAVTNGCFDILHRGHAECLQWAREQADALVVAINSDRAVRLLKGEGRPVNNQLDRAYMLASLSCVDAVCIVDSARMDGFFSLIRPDVYVKGGDYGLDRLDPGERDALMAWRPVPEFRFFRFRTMTSTTSILERVNDIAGKGTESFTEYVEGRADEPAAWRPPEPEPERAPGGEALDIPAPMPPPTLGGFSAPSQSDASFFYEGGLQEEDGSGDLDARRERERMEKRRM